MPPLVLLSAHDGGVWRHQLASLSRRTDVLIGNLMLDDTLADMAARILAAAPPRFALAAQCMGGYLAFEILRQAPERVERLALINTSARSDTPSQAAGRLRRLESLAGKAEASAEYLSQALLWMVAPAHLKDEGVAGPAREAIGGISPSAAIRQQKAMAARPDSRAGLASLTMPTLVVGGAQDRICPVEMSVEIAGLIAGSRLEILDPCGHLAPLERPDRLGAMLLDWLEAP